MEKTDMLCYTVVYPGCGRGFMAAVLYIISVVHSEPQVALAGPLSFLYLTSYTVLHIPLPSSHTVHSTYESQ